MSVTEAGLSERGLANYEPGSVRIRYDAIYNNLYHPKTNPTGLVNLGVSENYVMSEDVAKFANENVKLRFSGYDIHYGDGPWGSERLRQAMADHIMEYFQPFAPVDEENILFVNGCTGLFDLIGYTIAEPEEGILVSSPCYGSFQRDFGARAAVRTVPVPFNGVDQFSIEAVECYEKTFQESNASGTRIRALLICNPHNPLGQLYPPDVLQAYMEFCAKHNIHLIVDEIYAVSCYKTPTLPRTQPPYTEIPNCAAATSGASPTAIPFHSALRFEPGKHLRSTHLHVLYGLSKDFAAGGLRLGCVVTRSAPLLQSLAAFGFFSWPSNASEALATALLRDREWRAAFHERSQRVLASCAETAVRLLDGLGVPHNAEKAAAGFFLWIDLRRWVGAAGGGWDGEKVVRRAMQDAGLYLTPGVHMSAEEPGFFRLCFARTEEEVREGVRRLRSALSKFEDGVNSHVDAKLKDAPSMDASNGMKLENKVEQLEISS